MKQMNWLSKMSDPLEKVAAVVDFEQFRGILDEIFSRPSTGCGKAGRKP
jgi:hypothetical protein